MEIRKLIFPLHKWWWLLLLSTVAAAGASFYATREQPIIYQARTTIMVGTTINDPNPSGSDFAAGEQLAAAYAEMANRELVREATMEKLGINRLPAYIARSLPKTQLLEIVVTASDPQRSQVVANELAAQLILLSPTSLDPDEQARQDFVNLQLDKIEKDLNDTRAEIDELKAGIGDLDSAQDIASAQQQLTALESKLNTLNSTYASLLATTNQQSLNTLTVIEPAGLPSTPLGPGQSTTILLAAAVGLVLAVSAAYILEFLLDNTLKFPEDVESMFDSSIIGHIFTFPVSKRGKTLDKLIENTPTPITEAFWNPNTEAFWSLRTNLLFTEDDKSLKTILVASPDKQRGITQFVIDLATTLAEGGKSVLLVDANFRHPEVHTILQLPNEKGLGDVLMDNTDLTEVIQPIEDSSLSLITSGTIPPNPVERLDSKKMDDILKKLKTMADIVIFDSPPFVFAESSIIASKMDGVLALVYPTLTKKGMAEIMAEQIKRSHAKMLGIVLNNIPGWGAVYFAKVPKNQYYYA